MSTAIQRRRGTTTEHNSFTGLAGELSIDTTKNTVVVHDGSTVGGFPLALSNSTQPLTSGNLDVTGSVTADGADNTTYFIGGSDTVAGRQLTLSCEAQGGQNNATHRITVPSGYGEFAVTVGASERMRISSTGNVGIGESSGIDSRLHIKTANAATTLKLERREVDGILVDGDGIGSILFESNDDTAGASGVRAQIDAIIQNTSGGAYLKFSTANSGSTVSEAMRIAGDGSVLIGSGTASTYVDVVLNGASTSNYGPLLQLQSGGATFGKISNYGRIQGGTSTDMFVTTSTTNSLVLGTNNTSRMVISSTGNVGIGTSSNFNGTLNVFNGTDFSTASSASVDNIYLISDATSGDGVYGASISFSRVQYPDRRVSAIASVQSGSDEDNVGLAFFTHPSTNASDPIVEAMRLDSAGNMGLGVTPKSLWSSSYDVLQMGEQTVLYAHESGVGNDSSTYLGTNIYNEGGVEKHLRADESARYRQQAGSHKFSVNNGGTINTAISWTTAMTIDNVGNVLIGTSSVNGVDATTISSGGNITLNTSTTHNGQYATFRINGTQYGSIVSNNGNSVAFVTSSDYRLKENVVPMSGSIDRLKQLKPSRFNFISTPDKTVDGFLAHEAQAIVPECVTGEKDAMMTEEYEVTPAVMDGETVVTEAVMGERSVPDMQGIDQAKLVPLLVGAIQELTARLETLENK